MDTMICHNNIKIKNKYKYTFVLVGNSGYCNYPVYSSFTKITTELELFRYIIDVIIDVFNSVCYFRKTIFKE